MTVTDPARPDFKGGIHGWDLTQWRKLALIWAYSEPYDDYQEGENVAAGNHSLPFSTVPAGEVWVVDTFCAWVTTNNPTRISLRAGAVGTEERVRTEQYPTAYATVNVPTRILLPAGHRLLARFIACALNDDIRARANGYKMHIAE